MSFSVDKCKIVHFGKANKTYDYSLDGQPSFYYEISGGHIGSCRCSEEGLCRPRNSDSHASIRMSLIIHEITPCVRRHVIRLLGRCYV